MKKYRYSLLFLFSLPMAVSYIFCLKMEQNCNIYILLAIALVNESIFLNEISDYRSKDKGLLSAFFISITISLIVFISSENSIPLYRVIISSLLIVFGCALRTYSKFVLGLYFSHTLRIVNDHKLIETGLFKYIRHPAYTGTICLMSGFCLLLNVYFAIFFFMVFVSLALARIKNEESMMQKEFGNVYSIYKLKTWKLFPFII
jgi:protein-S-isoprenylcysteine O-methyltransferase Ste14